MTPDCKCEATPSVGFSHQIMVGNSHQQQNHIIAILSTDAYFQNNWMGANSRGMLIFLLVVNKHMTRDIFYISLVALLLLISVQCFNKCRLLPNCKSCMPDTVCLWRQTLWPQARGFDVIGIQQGTSIYESAYFSLLTTVKPPRRIGLFPTCSGIFLVVAASVLALASRMDHHWYLKVGLLSMGCKTVHWTLLLASKFIYCTPWCYFGSISE